MTALVFGKLPAHGDFVARGLDAARRERLDDWLSVSLSAARDAYGAAFEDRFDHAPPWHCEGPGVAGAIAASQDAAGRRFPLLLLCEGAPTDAARCEELLYAAITQGWTADRLAEEGGAAPAGTPVTWRADGEVVDGEMPAALLTSMLARTVTA